MATDDTTDPTASGASTDPSSNGTSAPEAKLYTKAEHTATIAREVAKERLQRETIQRERDELAAKVAEADAAREQAELAKLSATEREKRQRESETTTLKAERDAAKAEAVRERTARHGTAIAHAASRKVASVAASLSHPGLATDFEREVAAHAVVQVDASGVESVAWQHAPGDVVPFEEGFKAHEAAGHFARFMRVATGSGAQHGSGGGVGGARASNLVDALVNAQRR